MRSNGWKAGGPRAPRWLLVMVAPAAIQLALAGSALADTYTVDAITDDPDFAAPEVVFTRLPGDTVKSKKRMSRVSFEFSATAHTPRSAEVRFECSLDGGPFLPCVSPESAKVSRGDHSFQVRARDTLGVSGAVAQYAFKVVKAKKAKKAKKNKKG